MNSKKGFTLIELLVVIAIIGILAGIVLTSLGSARNKAKDASAIASMSSMRAQAELGVSSNSKYVNNFCNLTTGGAGEIGTLLAAARSQLGGDANVDCYDDDSDDATTTVLPSNWRVEGDLLTSNFYCVDSTGFAGDVAVTNTTAGDYTCN